MNCTRTGRREWSVATESQPFGAAFAVIREGDKKIAALPDYHSGDFGTNKTFLKLIATAHNESLDSLAEKILRLEADLATCYRLTGADPDGNEDWRLAPRGSGGSAEDARRV